MRPTEESYNELQQAYDYFNKELFNSILPDCLITLQRERRTYGYVSYNRFTNTEGKQVHEMAMNPSYFAVCDIQEIMQTLVHEMCHIWQYHNGKPGRGRYHNKQWGDFMESIGLMPSDTGKPGGKRTGDQMMDYMIDGGLFHTKLTVLLNGDFHISWIDRFPEQPIMNPSILGGASEEAIRVHQEKIRDLDIVTPDPVASKSNRMKYSCPRCSLNVWGKPELNIKCMNCDIKLKEN